MSKLAHSNEETMEQIELMAESRYGMLEPESESAYAAAANAFKELNSPLASAVKDITDTITSQVHDYMANWLEGDLMSNFHGMVRERADRIIKGLLNGTYDEATAKQWIGSFDFADYRKGVAEKYPELITNVLVAELMAENKRLRESLEWARR